MELVSFAKEAVRALAEKAASYRLGQTALRQLDRGLWVVEKCARWAVPPPLDQDERPQPELIRPLPWVLFLMMLVALRLTRESISLLNLVLGKPPLRSADVVMYIQSKRRYLRALKYQGGRSLRARGAASWLSRLAALLQVTMCFRPRALDSARDEVLVVRRKQQREKSPAAEASMERLIERMMVDLDADSEDDSSFTLTNATSLRSDRSDCSESEQDSMENNNDTLTNHSQDNHEHPSPIATPPTITTSTPEKDNDVSKDKPAPEEKPRETKDDLEIQNDVLTSPEHNQNTELEDKENRARPNYSPKTESNKFIQAERSPKNQQKSPKIANGRAMGSPGKRKGLQTRTSGSEVPVVRVSSADDIL